MLFVARFRLTINILFAIFFGYSEETCQGDTQTSRGELVIERLIDLEQLGETLREYSLTETYHEDDVQMEFVSSGGQPSKGYGAAPTPRAIDPNQDLNEAIAEERREMDGQRYRYWTPSSSREQQQRQRTGVTSRDNKAAIMDSIALSYGNIQQQQQQQQRKPTTPKSTMTAATPTTGRPTMRVHLAYPFADSAKQSWQYYPASRASAEAQKAQIFEDIQRKIVNGSAPEPAGPGAAGNSLEQQRRYRAKHHRPYSRPKRPRTRPPRDCKVGDWGAWSACSRSCGVGETQRTRRVLIKPRRGGRACPPLKETKWCGSVSPCPAEAAQPGLQQRW